MKKLISLAVAAASLASTTALAQGERFLEEVIVTATKRETTVKDVAGTVNVVTAESVRPGWGTWCA